MPHLTFLQLAQKVLEEEGRPLSPEEIWASASDKGYDKSVASQGKTPWRTIGAQLYVEIRDNPASAFVRADSRPTRFWLSALSQTKGRKISAAPLSPQILKRPVYSEKDLHPFLAYYGFRHLRAHMKTINHNRSRKDEFGDWVHPDMVGCYFLFRDWKAEVNEISPMLGNVPVRLFSFELKKELSFSNLRAAFFQAVSNSSWAHEGYLVAPSIADDADFRDELERLSSAFGIGIIKLDLEDPDSTEIPFPARPKGFLDWDTVNKLTFNPDFTDLLRRIKNDVSSREVVEERYDAILSKEELARLLNRHGDA